jgi:malate dehydrogenase
MAMVFKKYSGAEFVISTGTNLESLRFRSKLARTLKAPVSQVHGWVGGEHGTAAAILWSTVKINNLSVEEYSGSRGITFSRDELESYVKDVSKFIVDCIGGTEYGPAASFLEITRAIAKDTKEMLAVATPTRFDEIPDPVHVSVPLTLGASIGPTLFEALTEEERTRIKNAAQAIYSNYQTTLENI